MTGKSAPKKEGRRPRREVPPMKVWVTDDEKAEIADRAAQAGLSLSAYLLAAGLHHPIRSRVDLTAVGDLAKVNGDLGRVAGLLKLWLAEKRGQGTRPKSFYGIRFIWNGLSMRCGRRGTSLMSRYSGILHRFTGITLI